MKIEAILFLGLLNGNERIFFIPVYSNNRCLLAEFFLKRCQRRMAMPSRHLLFLTVKNISVLMCTYLCACKFCPVLGSQTRQRRRRSVYAISSAINTRRRCPHDGVEYGFEAVFGAELSAALGGDRPVDRASAAERLAAAFRRGWQRFHGPPRKAQRQQLVCARRTALT